MFAWSSCVCKKNIETLLESRRLKENTQTVIPYRVERKYEIVTDERQERNKVKREKWHWVKLEDHRGVCICQKS
jgi:hypothetical protein